MKTEKRKPGRPRKEPLVIPRAKWGSKTKNGKPVIPSDGSLRPYINGVRPRIPKDNDHDKLVSARAVLATMIAEGQDSNWTPFIRETVKNILF